jgi:predicted permease
MTPAGNSTWNDEIVVDGFHPRSMEDAITWFNEVSPGYFSTMETRLIAGRDFGPEDVPGGPHVAIVNDAWARRFFDNASALGREFRLRQGDKLSAPYAIVGVVENAKYQSLRENAEPIAYLAHSQAGPPGPVTNLVVRTAGAPEPMAATLMKAIGEVHSGLTLSAVTLERQLALSLHRERVLALLSGLFGAVAVSLAMLGLYGVQSYAVARRRAELGVRLALGAERGRVVRLVLRDVVVVLGAGVVVGAFGAVAASGLVRKFLYGVAPADRGVYGSTIALLALVAIAAGLVPAWRASRVDPLEALRES